MRPMDMKDRILEIAQRLIQQRGVNGFSYADIAKEVGVSKPSLHHHFATKTDLIARLMEQYTGQLVDYLKDAADRDVPAKQKLQAYCDLYRYSLDQERMCMGGMLSAEALTLDVSIHPLLGRFFDYQQQWLVEVLKAGEASGELKLAATAEQQASVMIATLQGSLMVSRASQNTVFFEQSVEGLFSVL